MFADFTKKEFVQTALGGICFIVIGYMTMLGVLLIIS